MVKVKKGFLHTCLTSLCIILYFIYTVYSSSALHTRRDDIYLFQKKSRKAAESRDGMARLDSSELCNSRRGCLEARGRRRYYVRATL